MDERLYELMTAIRQAIQQARTMDEIQAAIQDVIERDVERLGLDVGALLSPAGRALISAIVRQEVGNG